MRGNGHFGHWFTDEFELPAYEYTCNHELDPKALYFTVHGSSRDHWHQLGNDHLNVLAHNGGFVEVVESSRGLQWLTRRDSRRMQSGGGIGIIQDNDKGIAWSDLFSQTNYGNGYRRVFGTGYFRKTSQRHGMTLDHVVFPPFSDDPVIISELNLVNNSNSAKNLILYDYWGVNIRSIIAGLIYFDRQRKYFGTRRLLNVAGRLVKLLGYATRHAPEQVRDSFSSKFEFNTGYVSHLKSVILEPVYKGRDKPAENQPCSRNYYPKPVFLSALDAVPIRSITSTQALLGEKGKLSPHEEPYRRRITAKDIPCLSLGVEVKLKPEESRKLTFLFGYANKDRASELIDDYDSQLSSATRIALKSSSEPSPFPLLKNSAEEWRRKVFNFDVDDERHSWAGREAKWHSYYLRSATLYDEYFENHLLPQGGAYNYLQGLQGAPRDFMLFTIPMVYIEPCLAREMLEYTMRLMSPNGKLPYMTHGFGMIGGAFIHESPSDLSLFFLLALSEYVFATRDFEFLNKRVPFYPRSSEASSTVYERVKLAIDFLLNNVGIGEHDLIKIGDGDWNDPISTMASNRGKFVEKGESMFNTALALYVLPRIVSLLRKDEKEYGDRIKGVWEKLREACLKSWNGKWFYRAWDGSGYAIGDRNIFLEPLVWLLISRTMPPDYVNQLIKSIYEKLDKPSPFGQYIVFPPLNTSFGYLEKGWDVNGGIWFAINSYLTWGYGIYDINKAWNSLVKNSMAHHAELYPDTWYGIWSGPDAFNASYAPRSGETYYHMFTPTTDFPVMNLNLHANFLTALLRLAGIEPTLGGLSIDPMLPFKRFTLRTPVLELKISDKEIQGSYSPQAPGELTLRVKLPQHWKKKEVKCLIDESMATLKLVEEPPVAEIQIRSTTLGFKFRLTSSQ
nr:hypothetical protein [Candidatus Njordarchaeum guaymaensis]